MSDIPILETNSRISVTLDIILKTLLASPDFNNQEIKNWDAISRLIPGTTAGQCARRYEALQTNGSGVSIQHLIQTFSSNSPSTSNSGGSLVESESTVRSSNSRPNSSKIKVLKEEKENLNANRGAYQQKDVSQKGPVMVIHVCDETKNLKKDFHCPRDLLIQEMKYFAEYLSTDAQRLEDVDISVHCDVQIFDWLMRFVKKGTKEFPEEPKLEITNVVSILISSEFLKMDALVTKCIGFLHKNISDVVATPCNMGCINDNLLQRISNLFSHNEVDEIRDRKDKIKSKLFAKKIESLFDSKAVNPDSPEKAYSLFRCVHCNRHLTESMKPLVKCLPSRMTINRNGESIYFHVVDTAFDVNDFLLELKQSLKTWRDVYFRLWGMINYFNCIRCGEIFPLTDFGHCVYHPELARYDNEPGSVTSCVGIHPCCHQRAIRFDPTHSCKGCRVKDHIMNLTPTEGEKSTIQSVYDDFLTRRDIICVPYQRPTDYGNMQVDVFTNEMFVCHTYSSGQQLPSLSAYSLEEGNEVKPRLRPLLMEKEISYYVDDVGDESEEDEEDEHQSNTGSLNTKRSNRTLKKSLITVDPQGILMDAPEFDQMKKNTWDVQKSLRYNQDVQRQEDARRMKEMRLFLTRLRLTPEKVDKPKKEYPGGIFSKLESQWKANHLQFSGRSLQPLAFKSRPKPLVSTKPPF